MAEQTTFAGWAILELMGHRRLGGYCQEQEIAGQAFIRIDVPADEASDGDEPAATQFYAPAAVYCITPTTEAMARAVARRERPEPVHRWELPAPKAEPPAHVCPRCGTSVREPGLCVECEEDQSVHGRELPY